MNKILLYIPKFIMKQLLLYYLNYIYSPKNISENILFLKKV